MNETVYIQASLAADGLDGNGLQLEKFRLNFSSCFSPCVFKKSKLIAGVLSLSANLSYIFLLMFKDDVFHGLSCLPIISEQLTPKIAKFL